MIAASSTAYVYHKTKAEEVMHTEAQKWLYECGSWRKKVERCKLEVYSNFLVYNSLSLFKYVVWTLI